MPVTPLDELRAGLAERCAEVLARHRCPSVSVAVVRGGDPVLTEAHGRADLATDRPATPDTPYAIASITKPLTATAVCIAADRGLLDLDAPDSDPAAPASGAWRAPTVRELLQHRAGLAAHYDFRYDPAEPELDVDFYGRPYREPGVAFRYANLGYRRLGRLLEAATGRPLADYLAGEVFGPLGLAGCHLGPTYPGAAATRYTVDGRAYPGFVGTSHPGATLGWATAVELALFAQSYDRLLAPATAPATVAALPVNDHLGYGLGWCVSTGGGPLVRSHGGGMGGVAAMVVAVPELELSVAVLSNSTNKAARNEIVDHVLGTLVPGWTPESVDPAVRPERREAPGERTWSGRIDTPEGPLPVQLEYLGAGQARLVLAGTEVVGAMPGPFDLQLPTADARRNSPSLLLDPVEGIALAYKDDGDAAGLLGNLLPFPLLLAS